MRKTKTAEKASSPTMPDPSAERHIRCAAYGLLFSGFVYLFLTGTEIAAQGKLILEITFLHLFAGIGLLNRCRFWRIFTLFSTGFYLLTHIIILPLILLFLIKAEHYPELLWIGGAEHPSAPWFFITFTYEFLICIWFVYTFLILLQKNIKSCFLPLTQVSPLPRLNKSFAIGAFAGLLITGAGYGIQKTGWLKTSPDILETDVLYSSSGKQLRPGPDGILRIPEQQGNYYGLLAQDHTPDGLSFWCEVQLQVTPDGTAYCKTLRYIPSLLTIEKSFTLLPTDKPFYLERTTGKLRTEKLASGKVFREFQFIKLSQ